MVWNAIPMLIDAICMMASTNLHDWNAMDSSTQPVNLSSHPTHHGDSKMHADMVFCRVNAKVLPERRVGFYGIVILSPSMGFIAARRGPLCCLGDPHTTEALAMKEGGSFMDAYKRLEEGSGVVILFECSSTFEFVIPRFFICRLYYSELSISV